MRVMDELHHINVLRKLAERSEIAAKLLALSNCRTNIWRRHRLTDQVLATRWICAKAGVSLEEVEP